MSLNVALAGNPNCGKTTLFNEITGSKQHVGNWPGVTVEKKEGKYKKDKGMTIVDLPGIYSLSPYSAEEIVARNYIVEEKPDVLINIIDEPLKYQSKKRYKLLNDNFNVNFIKIKNILI